MSFAHGLRPEFRFPNGLFCIAYFVLLTVNQLLHGHNSKLVITGVIQSVEVILLSTVAYEHGME